MEYMNLGLLLIEDQYDKIFENDPDGILTLDQKGFIVYCNVADHCEIR